VHTIKTLRYYISHGADFKGKGAVVHIQDKTSTYQKEKKKIKIKGKCRNVIIIVKCRLSYSISRKTSPSYNE